MTKTYCYLKTSVDGSDFANRLYRLKVEYMKKERNDLLSDNAKLILRERYMTPEESCFQEMFARCAAAFSDSMKMAIEVYDAISQLHFLPATPFLSNGGTNRGLPISCFLEYVDDSREGLAQHYSENIYHTTSGGGIGAHWSSVRSKGLKTSQGSETSGLIPFLKVADAQVPAFNQGVTRRGAYAAYLHVSHPEIKEFINLRKTTGGDLNRRCFNLFNAVIIDDVFMIAVAYNETYSLVDPHTCEVVEVVEARDIWQEILQSRIERGTPYIYFEDTCNKGEYDLDLDLPIGVHLKGSNLCTEIIQPTGKDYSAVCALAHIVLPKVLEDVVDISKLVRLMNRFIDNGLEVYLQNEHSGISSSCNAIRHERNIGIGLLGFWDACQQTSLVSEYEISAFNKNLFQYINGEVLSSSVELGKEKGYCPATENLEEPRRNAHLMAIAPNATTSLIANTSPGIEPWRAGVFKQKILDGSTTIWNPTLVSKLEELDLWNEETKNYLIRNKGSVQGLEGFPEDLKFLFRTAVEINQKFLIKLAADRQGYIDQSQALNLFFSPEATKKEIHEAHITAWEGGIKTLYYLRTTAKNRSESVAEVSKRKMIQMKEPLVITCDTPLETLEEGCPV